MENSSGRSQSIHQNLPTGRCYLEHGRRKSAQKNGSNLHIPQAIASKGPELARSKKTQRPDQENQPKK